MPDSNNPAHFPPGILLRQSLRQRIAIGRAKTLADAAVQFRRLAVEAEAEGPSLRGLLGEPDMRGLVASVLAVVEREADAESTPAA